MALETRPDQTRNKLCFKCNNPRHYQRDCLDTKRTTPTKFTITRIEILLQGPEIQPLATSNNESALNVTNQDILLENVPPKLGL